MSPTLKSLSAAAAVILSAGAILGGVLMRDRVDVGGSSMVANATDSIPMTGLVASTNKSEVPEGDYFYEITNLLKQRYVEQISDEQKLALGAIRGMVSSLGDPDSLFLDKDQFAVHQGMRLGKYQGIGAQLELIYLEPKDKDSRGSGQPIDPEEALLGTIRIPKLTVVCVVPGGPADKAGVKIGDYVEYVDDHWVPNAETVASFRKLQRDFNAGKVSFEALSKVRLELTKRMKKTILPLKAREKLLAGETGLVNMVWKRGFESRVTKIAKAPSQMPLLANSDGTIRLLFANGVDQELQSVIEGKDAVVIDLRNNANGLSGPMKKCLELLVPKGKYGQLTMGNRKLPIEISGGSPRQIRVSLLVDKSTRGVAEVFADILVKAGVAQKPVESMAGHPILVDDFPLPDGSGYTLAVASYQSGAK